MNNGAKAAIGATAVLILAVGGQLLWLHHERNAPVAVKAPEREVIADDDLVFLKKKRPDTLKDVKELDGLDDMGVGGWPDGVLSLCGARGSVWQECRDVAGSGADRREGRGGAGGAEGCDVSDSGRRQAGAAGVYEAGITTRKEYAVPVGYRQAGQYTFYTDEIFFYDDPHELYKHWGPEIWKAVDTHEVILGMNERQVELSLGQVSQSTSKDYGNRMVVFANMGKPMAVTFVKNKVTAFRPDQGF